MGHNGFGPGYGPLPRLEGDPARLSTPEMRRYNATMCGRYTLTHLALGVDVPDGQ